MENKQNKNIIIIILIVLLIIALAFGGFMLYEKYKNDQNEGDERAYTSEKTSNTEGNENKITLSEVEKEKIMAMMEYADYTGEFGFDTIEDSVLAGIGVFLAKSNGDYNPEGSAPYSVKKDVFEKNIKDFFGQTIKEPEKLGRGIRL